MDVFARAFLAQIPRSQTVSVPGMTPGLLFKLRHYLGSTSALSLVAAESNANLSLAGDYIQAASQIGIGQLQVAQVREYDPDTKRAYEYALTLSGSTIVDTVPGSVTMTYDTSFGSGMASDGLTNLPLRPTTAKRIWVNSATGSDSNNGLTPATAKKTVAAGWALTTNGNGDQLMLAGTFAENLTDLRRNGYSLQYPTVVQSYDPADPTNEAKYGRAPRAVLSNGLTSANVAQMLGFARQADYVVVRGIDFNPAQSPGCAASVTTPETYGVMFENNIFRHCAVGFDFNGPVGASLAIFRRNVVYGPYNTSLSHGIGFYAASCRNLTLEDNIFFNCGFPVGAGRNDLKATSVTATITLTAGSSTATVSSTAGIAAGQWIDCPNLPAGTVVATISGTTITLARFATKGAAVTPLSPGSVSAKFGATYTDVYQHCIYLSVYNDNVVARRNIIMDGCSHGLQMRSGGLAYHNVLIDNPIHLVHGFGDDYGRTYAGSNHFFFNVVSLPAPGDTITVQVGSSSFTLTARASGATTGEYNIGATTTATATNIAAAFTAASGPVITAVKAGTTYAIPVPGGTVSIPPGFRANLTKVFVDYNPAENGDAQLTLSSSSSAVTVDNRSAYSAASRYHPDPLASQTLGHRPSGVSGDLHHNLLLGSADINVSLPRRWAFDTMNGTSTSKFRQNLVLGDGVNNGVPFQVNAWFPQPSYIKYDRNVVYGFGTATWSYNIPASLSALTYRTDTNNIWDFPSSGTNVNKSGLTFPGAKVRDEIFTLVGLATGFPSIVDKASFLAVALGKPEVNWAKAFIEAALPAYGVSLADV